VPDAPDPLGKRALFWAPAERHEEGPRTPDVADVPGKHALFSDVSSVRTPSDSGSRSRPTGFDRAITGRPGHPSNRRPPVADAGRESKARAVVPDDLERPSGSGMFGSLNLQCSTCRVSSRVDLVEYIVLHLPVWLWRPGRGYANFMTCPACRRRTWVSASWTRSAR